MKNILSIDLGTTALKIILFASNGRVLGKSTQEYKLLTPSTLAVELPVEVYWNAFKKGISEALAKSRERPSSIEAIGISAQGETLIPLGKDNHPLMNAIVWLDNRAQEEAKTIASEFGNDKSYHITGQVSIVPTWPASKIFWIKRNLPDLFKKVSKFLLIEDYFIHRMTGKFVCEGSLVCSTVYWNIIKKCWWPEMLHYLGITEQNLPELRESGEAIGPLKPEVAKDLGLSEKTIVCTGALDQACGAIGVGNIYPGVISENIGAALAICATVDHPVFDAKRQMPCHYHGIPNTYMAHTFTTGGMVLKWYRDNFCSSEIQVASITGMDNYDLLGQEAGHVPAGCDGLVMLPHLQGAMAPEDNPLAKGVFFGFTLHHSKPFFIRSIMEAIACAINRNINVLEEMGIKVEEIRSLGGGARSELWNQIKCDVTRRSLYTMQNEEAACLGAAMLAGVATGIFTDLKSAVKKLVVLKKRYDPQKENFEIYGKVYEKYVELYNSLMRLFAKSL